MVEEGDDFWDVLEETIVLDMESNVSVYDLWPLDAVCVPILSVMADADSVLISIKQKKFFKTCLES